MAASVKKVLDSILAMLLERLAPEGFVLGKDLTLIRSTPNSVCAVNLQPGKYNTKTQGQFTVNIWLWYPELAHERGEKGESVQTTGGLHLTQRLAMLASSPGQSAPADKWWQVSATTEPDLIFAEIYSLWEQSGRDWLAQNGNLRIAMPRLVRQWSEYHHATALYAAGHVEEARRIARPIWRGEHPGFPERIEWAWRRELFNLDDLKAALADEHYQTRLVALDTLWRIARIDPSVTALSGELASQLALDPDPIVVRQANELRQSIYLRGGTLRIIPRDVPSLKDVPRNAIIAFSARCARRVQNSIATHWKGGKEERVKAISDVLQVIEDIGAAQRLRSDAKILSKQLDPIRRAARRAAEKAPDVALAVSAMEAVGWAAQSAYGGATAGEVAARMSTHAVPETHEPQVRKAIWEDFDLLVELAGTEGWTDDAPVAPDRFPPLISDTPTQNTE